MTGESAPNYRAILALTTVVLTLSSVVAVKRSVEPEEVTGIETSLASAPSGSDETVASVAGIEGLPEGAVRGADGVIRTKDGRIIGPDGKVTAPPVTNTPGTSTAQGVTDTEIRVTYYWKGDRTSTSPYLGAAGQSGNVDEGKAFMALVDWINKNPGADFMGTKINLHGRKLVGNVLEAGQAPDSYAATAQHIIKTVKPFAAVAAHGSLSDYICPALASAGIFNLDTYDLGGDLVNRTNGYCIPAGLTWEKQVEATKNYLLADQRANPARVYGVLYAEYPGLKRAAGPMIEALKSAGVKIAADVAISASLTESQQQVGNAVAKFRGAGVNYLIIPDAGAPMNFTNGAEAQQYRPDYYVWPCSGQDTTAMVRLYNAAQWSRASGLTCYDKQFTPDLTNNTEMMNSRPSKAYQESTGDSDVPAPTQLVYAALYQLVAGVSGAGRNLTPATYKAALDRAEQYRWDMVDGRTDDPTNILLTLNTPDRSMIGDVARLRWSASATNQGSTTPGAYVYPDPVRYAPNHTF